MKESKAIRVTYLSFAISWCFFLRGRKDFSTAEVHIWHSPHDPLFHGKRKYEELRPEIKLIEQDLRAIKTLS